ncbi:MAG: acetyltransferase [Erysipelotrichia bacterium]|nr:acetyltransferase [Erysipelotrichia bacterium]
MENYLYTKLFYPQSRIIRLPFYVRGRRYMNLGKRLTTGVGCRLDAFPSEPKVVLHVGNDVQINDYVHIGAIHSVTIKDRVLIASKVFITDHNHGSYGSDAIHTSPLIPPIERVLSSAAVLIEEDVWIGEFVSILPGVTIGKGSIIGTMSVVTKDIPPYSIALGSPAKVIKQFNFEKNEWIRV